MSQLISYKNIFKLAFPVTISQSTIVISGLTDLAFVSRYGTRAIAAVSIANVIIATLYNFLEGIRAGTTVLVSKAAELKEDEQITATLNIGLAVSLAVGLPVAFLGKYIGYFAYRGFSDNLIRLLGTDYLKIWLFAVPITLVLNVIFGVFRGFSDTVTPLKVSIVICVSNAVFDYILVCGKLGMPGMGTKGSAYATLFSSIAGLLFMAALLVKKRPIAQYFYFQKAPADYFKKSLRLMMEIGIYTGFMNLAMAVFAFMMGSFGSRELAIHQITFQIFLISYLLTMGFLVSASIVVPKLTAQKQADLIIKNVSRICKVSLGAICILSFALYLFAPGIAAFFSLSNQAVIANVTKTIRIVSFAQLFTSVYMTLRGALTGCGDTKFIAYEGGISGYNFGLPFLI